jgi:hypothetical protein
MTPPSQGGDHRFKSGQEYGVVTLMVMSSEIFTLVVAGSIPVCASGGPLWQ